MYHDCFARALLSYIVVYQAIGWIMVGVTGKGPRILVVYPDKSVGRTAQIQQRTQIGAIGPSGGACGGMGHPVISHIVCCDGNSCARGQCRLSDAVILVVGTADVISVTTEDSRGGVISGIARGSRARTIRGSITADVAHRQILIQAAGSRYNGCAAVWVAIVSGITNGYRCSRACLVDLITDRAVRRAVIAVTSKGPRIARKDADVRVSCAAQIKQAT